MSAIRCRVFLAIWVLGSIFTPVGWAWAGDRPPAFDHLALHVSDLEKNVAFYERLGLRRIADPFNDGRHVWLSLGPHQALHLIAGGTANHDREIDVHMAIRVASIRACMSQLDQQGIAYFSFKRELHEITTRPDGVKQIYLQDPDGYWLEINDARL